MKTDVFLSGLRHSRSSLLMDGVEALASTGDSVFAVRAALVACFSKAFVIRGHSAALQISESTLEKWVRTADREGFDGLLEGCGGDNPGSRVSLFLSGFSIS